LVAGDRSGFLTLFLETGTGLTNTGHIQANGVDIDVSYNSNPDVVDWDEDGKKDIIIGEHDPVTPNTGTIRLYLNSGTNAAPVFNDYNMLEAGGNQIYRYRADPRVFDLDQDGAKDLLVGEYDGRVYFYRNVGTNAAPVFNASYDTLRTVGSSAVTSGSSSRFHCVDWTGDGDFDIVISGDQGYVVLYENAYTGIEEFGQHESGRILSISPNPVAGQATFEYSLDQAADVNIKVYSIDGRYKASVIDGHVEQGISRFAWNVRDDIGRKLPAGIYFVVLQTDSEQTTQRMVVAQ
jgi:WD40 repeat protein